MSTDYSLNFFLAQALAAVTAFVLGRAAATRSRTLAEIILAVATLLAIGWALRFSAEDALLRLIPLDAFVYLEGTMIVPVFMLMVGVATVIMDDRRAWRVGSMGATFGLVYLAFNGAWMLTPRVEFTPASARAAPAEVVSQTRDDTCVAAALATALRSPAIAVDTSEAEMARLADVRVGQGATMLRALRAARLRLAPRGMEARLHVCSADDVVRMASPSRPVLVTVRSANVGQTHMIVIYGLSEDRELIVADPAAERLIEMGVAPLGRSFYDFEQRYPEGARRWEFDKFAELYMGRAIVFIDGSEPTARLISRR